VVDLGAGGVKAGYAGEDTPKAFFPPVRHWLALLALRLLLHLFTLLLTGSTGGGLPQRAASS